MNDRQHLDALAESAIWLDGVAPELAGYPGFAPGETVEDGMLIQRDVSIELGDGGTLYADIYRPANSTEPVPVILAWSSYGKHGGLKFEQFGNHGVDTKKLSAHTRFEAPDPVRWTTRGYAVVLPDPRGSWNSPGDHQPWSPQEVSDACDVIEWLGTRDWSTGRVGMSGVSYFTVIQWLIAAQNPAHLFAINPWEGVSDPYRELFFHGGMPETHFVKAWQNMMRASTGRVEDIPGSISAHPLLSDWSESKTPNLSAITIPAYVVASWSDHGMHTRGTLEGYRQISSSDKYLEVHGRKKWAYYYDEASLARQFAFFDRYLKDLPTEVETWPPVRIEIRERAYTGDVRAETEWPLARTQYRQLFLSTAGTNGTDSPHQLDWNPGSDQSEVTYDATTGGAVFDLRVEEQLELTGYMKLRLYVEARGADDMDIFVAVQKLDSDGNRVEFPFFAKFDDGDVALGWLRVSHRDFDPVRTTDHQPWHSHDREDLLSEGEVVPIDVEIWPSSTLFEAGSTLRLVIQGHDITHQEQFTSSRHTESRNNGLHVVHVGTEYTSHLLVPVIAGDAV